MAEISWQDFEKVEMRVGTVLSVDVFPEAKKPAFKLVVDFGPGIGTLKSSAQITTLYKKEDLVGRQVIAVVNFPPKQVANFHSECLIMGVVRNEGVVLLAPERKVENGSRIG